MGIDPFSKIFLGLYQSLASQSITNYVSEDEVVGMGWR